MLETQIVIDNIIPEWEWGGSSLNHFKFVAVHIIVIAAVLILLLLKPFRPEWLNSAVLLVFAAVPVFIAVFGKDNSRSLKNRIAQLETELRMLNKEVEVASSQVMSVSEQLYVTLDENNAFAQQLFAEAREMSDMNSEVNNKVKGVVGGINEIMGLLKQAGGISANMEQTSKSAEEALKAGFTEIRSMVSAVRDIRNASEMTKDSMDSLERTSGEIMNILDSVRSISNQTQLLSLNAAIESARAGEAGKGFAVVAGEIQKLSVETGNAVKNIGELVNSIGHQIQAVNQVVGENVRRVQIGVDVSGIMEQNTQVIDKSFSGIATTISDICSITGKGEELAKGLESMLFGMESNMESASSQVKDVYDSVHRQKHNIQDLAELGNRLNDASQNIQQLAGNSAKEENCMADKAKVDCAVDAIRKLTGELNAKLLNFDSEAHRSVLSGLLASQDFIEAAWSNDIKGRFICSIPGAGIANAMIREWFKRSAAGEEYISDVYISAITKKPCVTYSIPIKDRQEKIAGVFGVDLKL
jgi:methyl-accepting chemotaxis protein